VTVQLAQLVPSTISSAVCRFSALGCSPGAPSTARPFPSTVPVALGASHPEARSDRANNETDTNEKEVMKGDYGETAAAVSRVAIPQPTTARGSPKIPLLNVKNLQDRLKKQGR